MPLRRRPARRDDAARRDLLHPPRGAPAGQAAASSAPGPGSRCAGPGAASPRRRPPATSWCGSSGRDADRVDVAHLGVDAAALPRAVGRRAGRCPGAPRASTGRYVAFLGTLEPRKNAAGPGPRRGCRRVGPAATRPPSCWPAAAAGTTRSTAPPPRCPAGLPCCRPGLPAAGPARRVPRRGGAGRLSEPRRGLRAAGARGDGLRRAGADHPAAGPAGGRRRRRGLHRARRRVDRRRPPCAARRPGAARRAGRRGGLARAALFDWRSCARAHLAAYAAAAAA